MCPIDGGFTAWTAWAGCSVTCEQGTWTRTRSCTNPSPQYNGAPCSGATSQTQACDAGIMCPIDGGFTAWTAWAGCSVTCEYGTWGRSRSCTNPSPQYNGAPCSGATSQTTQCNAGIMCPIDGAWTPWSAWAGCSVTCELGIWGRSRSCTNPPAQYNGAPCTGATS